MYFFLISSYSHADFAAPLSLACLIGLNSSAYLQLRDLISSFREYYFSLHNLERDFFLRRKMDSQGFLPISLIAGFHRVQALTMDINLIMEVMTHHHSVKGCSYLALGYLKMFWHTLAINCLSLTHLEHLA